MKFYNEEDLQELLKLTELQIKALVRDPSFPSKKIGRTYIVEESALSNWLDGVDKVKLDYSKVFTGKR